MKAGFAGDDAPRAGTMFFQKHAFLSISKYNWPAEEKRCENDKTGKFRDYLLHFFFNFSFS